MMSSRSKVELQPFAYFIINRMLQIDETMMKKVLGYIEKGKSEGAKLLTGGKRVGTTGFYLEPAVFADVKDDMTIAKEEVCLHGNRHEYFLKDLSTSSS